VLIQTIHAVIHYFHPLIVPFFVAEKRKKHNLIKINFLFFFNNHFCSLNEIKEKKKK